MEPQALSVRSAQAIMQRGGICKFITGKKGRPIRLDQKEDGPDWARP